MAPKASFESAAGVVVQATDYRLKQPPRLRRQRWLRSSQLFIDGAATPPSKGLRKEGNPLLLTPIIHSQLL
jgi:hypothetical protein